MWSFIKNFLWGAGGMGVRIFKNIFMFKPFKINKNEKSDK